MNLDTIPDPEWLKLATVAIEAQKTRADVAHSVDDYFYNHIYSTWSVDKVTYKQNLPDSSDGLVKGKDAGWSQLVGLWKEVEATGSRIGAALKSIGGKKAKQDDSVGIGLVQTDPDPDQAKQITEARLYEHYNEEPSVSRFQFVVASGGGMVLFNRMRRACQECILEKYKHQITRDGLVTGFPIAKWKVFGEAYGEGRSDTCVVYLTQAPTSPALIEIVNKYIWPAVKDLVADRFEPIGFFRIDGKPFWTLTFPSESRELSILGRKCEGSSGGLMGTILGTAFAAALRKSPTTDAGVLTAAAKLEAVALIKRLYPDGPI